MHWKFTDTALGGIAVLVPVPPLHTRGSYMAAVRVSPSRCGAQCKT